MLSKSNHELINMFGSRIIADIYNSSKNAIKLSYEFIKNIPSLYIRKITEWKDYAMDFRYRLNNLRDSNFALGLYHLERQNLNDAIIRFKLVDKFFKSNDPEANYWLGWCYFLKNNPNKALKHLQNSLNIDKVGLGKFLLNYQNCQEVPKDILTMYRDFTAAQYISKFNSDKVHLPYSFTQKIMDNIKDIPDEYNILELGSNVGIAGYEIVKRLPDTFYYTGVETSQKMQDLVNIYYQNYNIYDEQLKTSLADFIKDTKTNKYDIILSFCGLSFTKNLAPIFSAIYELINNNGYFAFCLPTNKQTEFSLKRNEFIYNINDLKDVVMSSKFTLLSYEELTLGINNNFAIFVCRKVE